MTDEMPSIDDNENIQYSIIINEKHEGGNNYLHMLVDRLTETNYGEVSKMIKLMLLNGCCPNNSNDKNETPFSLLLKKSSYTTDLIEFFVQKSKIDFQSHLDIMSMMEKRDIQFEKNLFDKAIKDVYCLMTLLRTWNESVFLRAFQHFKKMFQKSENFENDVMQLLEEAVVRNMIEVVRVLVSCGTNLIDVPIESSFKMAPAFLACFHGHHEVLKIILEDSAVVFEQNTNNLLHQLFMSEQVDENDRRKCFQLIINDLRCTLKIINGLDAKRRSPLLFSCHYGYDEITGELLKRGAYIGH